ncbi:MAG: hypothetical protein H6512_15000 [Acidimicrobiia bacterium]|nr:hypothetical protein [Acidimicrobiia bacterium]
MTFDSGGLSLKSGEGMMTMKCDMGGAAAVIAALAIVPIVAPNLSVRGLSRWLRTSPAAERSVRETYYAPGRVQRLKCSTPMPRAG